MTWLWSSGTDTFGSSGSRAGDGDTLARKTPASRSGPEATEGAMRSQAESTSVWLGKRSLINAYERCVSTEGGLTGDSPFPNNPVMLDGYIL